MKKCWALLAIAILFGSCNILFMPKKQKVEFVTGKKEAKVYVGNDEFGEGEIVKDKIKKDGICDVTVKTKGYRDLHTVIIPTHKPAGYVPLQILDLIIVILGNPNKTYEWNHAYDKIQNVNTQILLPKRSDSEKYLNFSGVDFNKKAAYKYFYTEYKYGKPVDLSVMMDNTEKDYQKYEEKKAKEKDAQEKKKPSKKKLEEPPAEDSKNVYHVSAFIRKTLYESGYNDTVNNIFHDNNNSLILEARINKALFHEFEIKHVFGNYGTVKANITWYIKNTYDQVIDSVVMEQQSEKLCGSRRGGNSFFEAHMNSALELSFLKFLETPTYKNSARIEKDFKVNMPKIELKSPTQVVDGKENAGEASVIVKTKSGHGSGFAITNDGYIITNYHLICDRIKPFADNIKVITSAGEELDVKVISFNKFTDVALIKVEKTMPRAFKLSTVKTFKNLQNVYTIGAPKSVELGQSVSTGAISNEREVNNLSLLQLNMSINTGNSGGPVFEQNGVLHGVIASKLVGKNTEGIAFAIPSYLVPAYLNINFK